MDNEVTEAWKEYHDDKKKRHERMHKANTEKIIQSGVAHKIAKGGETILFREAGMPSVDFYPSTGRWRITGKGASKAVYKGGAVSFLKWYEKRKAAE